MSARSPAQTAASVEANAQFFLNNIESYRRNVETLESYARIRAELDRCLSNVDHLLDIGNGGVFDYDATRVGSITALDLFFDRLPDDIRANYFPANAKPIVGSALAIPEREETFSAVLMVMLIHHLVGRTWRDNLANARKAFDEAARVLKPGGKLILVESCIPAWFYAFEKAVFTPTAAPIQALTGHPPAFQYPAHEIQRLLSEHFDVTEAKLIPKGAHVLQFGMKVPSVMTPVQPFIFVGRKK